MGAEIQAIRSNSPGISAGNPVLLSQRAHLYADHSKPAPYAALIREWRGKGLTLCEMASELERYGCQTTPQNLSLFLRNMGMKK